MPSLVRLGSCFLSTRSRLFLALLPSLAELMVMLMRLVLNSSTGLEQHVHGIVIFLEPHTRGR